MGRRDGGATAPNTDPTACRPAGRWSDRLSGLTTLIVVIAATGLPPPLAGEDPPAVADLPVVEEPILLSPSDVRQALGARLRRMEERHEEARPPRLRAPRDYHAPWAEDAALSPEQAPLTLPPDRAGGELQLERAGGTQ